MKGSEVVQRIDDLLWQQRKKKKDLFEACHITSSAYSQWNTGKANPSIKKLDEIAEWLNTSVEYLLTGQNSVAKESPATEFRDVEKEMYEIMTKLRDRPELRILMHNAENATPEQIQGVADMLARFKQE